MDHLVPLYDISWVLYKYSLRSPPRWASPAVQLDALIEQIQNGFRKPLHDGSAYEDYASDNGGIQDCTVEKIRVTTTCSGLFITITYEKTTHKFFLYGSTQINTSLLFANAPTSIMQRIFEIFADALDAPLANPFTRFQLPSSLIQEQMEAYLKTLRNAEPSNTLSLVEHVLRDISVAVTFEAPIAPTLRSLNLDLPPDTVRAMTQASTSNSNFLIILAEHLKLKTGLTLTPAMSSGV